VKAYYVFVKDPLLDKFWTVHVLSNKRLVDILSWASMKTFGGSTIGVQEFLEDIPPNFEHGKVVAGMIT
jgi:hypothetical protein